MTTATAPSLPGLHHVTAITGDAQRNLDFYLGVLGLRLVKLTVNFDDPLTYHLYYGDGLGRPGTVLTFFAWPGARRGQSGPPQVGAVAFAAPRAALDTWFARLHAAGAAPRSDGERFGEPVLAVADPDGLRLEIVGVEQPPGEPWEEGPLAAASALRGLHGVTLVEEGGEATAELLRDVLGWSAAGVEHDRHRFHAPAVAAGPPVAAAGSPAAAVPAAGAAIVDVLCLPAALPGSLGAGVVHHVAFRTAGDEAQRAWRDELVRRGRNVSPVKDRVYFHSIYFREPGGVLCEIATGGPGFTADQTASDLGTRLMLPPWLEPRRAEIESALPPVRLPPPIG